MARSRYRSYYKSEKSLSEGAVTFAQAPMHRQTIGCCFFQRYPAKVGFAGTAVNDRGCVQCAARGAIGERETIWVGK